MFLFLLLFTLLLLIIIFIFTIIFIVYILTITCTWGRGWWFLCYLPQTEGHCLHRTVRPWDGRVMVHRWCKNKQIKCWLKVVFISLFRIITGKQHKFSLWNFSLILTILVLKMWNCLLQLPLKPSCCAFDKTIPLPAPGCTFPFSNQPQPFQPQPVYQHVNSPYIVHTKISCLVMRIKPMIIQYSKFIRDEKQSSPNPFTRKL